VKQVPQESSGRLFGIFDEAHGSGCLRDSHHCRLAGVEQVDPAVVVAPVGGQIDPRLLDHAFEVLQSRSQLTLFLLGPSAAELTAIALWAARPDDSSVLLAASRVCAEGRDVLRLSRERGGVMSCSAANGLSRCHRHPFCALNLRVSLEASLDKMQAFVAVTRRVVALFIVRHAELCARNMRAVLAGEPWETRQDLPGGPAVLSDPAAINDPDGMEGP